MPSRSTLTTHTATVAMGSSRALTSHLRKLYERQYRGKRNRPAAAFALDVCFFVAAVALVIASAWFALAPVPQPGLRLSFSAPALTAGSPAAVDVTLRSADDRTYRDVRLTWHLPPGAQLFVASPHLSADGSLYLGQVGPDDAVTSRAVVRLFQPEGASAEFGFTVSYTDDQGNHAQFFGTERRDVTQTALTAAVPGPFHTDGVILEGAIIPIRIENRSDETLPFVHLFMRETSVHAEERIALGDIAPREIRWVYVPLVTREDAEIPDHGRVRLAWSVGSAARDLASGTWEADAVTLSRNETPRIPARLSSAADEPISVPVTNAAPDTRVLIAHPFLAESVQEQPLAPNGMAFFPPPLAPSGSNHEWLAAPVIRLTDGRRVLGPAARGVTAATAFPFAAQVRYRSSAGDQLGAGPHPPEAGIETRYWAFWTVGPVDSALKNLAVQTTLPFGVTPTGNVTAVSGGSVSISGRTVRWTLPSLGPDLTTDPTQSGLDRGQAQATVGFEISVTPNASDIGTILPLLATSTARAEDTHTSLLFTTDAGPLTSHLEEDGEGEGKGTVVEKVAD